jgi:hypothetical protein
MTNEIKKPLFLCSECSSPDLQTTAWITLNGEKLEPDEGPSDTIWCPNCQAEADHACCVDAADDNLICDRCQKNHTQAMRIALDKLIEEQGWNESSILLLARDFLRDTRQELAFINYLKKHAVVESEEE